MADRYEHIRAALAMGPTPGPWGFKELPRDMQRDGYKFAISRRGIGWRFAQIAHEMNSMANATYITACDPDTIRELLAERDQLAAELEAVRRDAERYRWLRKGESYDIAVVRGLGAMAHGMSAVLYTYSDEIYGDAMDAAIDAAMQRTTAREGKT